MINYLDRYEALQPDDRGSVDALLADIFDALESRNGAVIAILDKNGNGEAVLHGLGNHLILGPLARSAASLAKHFDVVTGSLPN